ncbi:50S ribosomal protein L11 methyltransferase [Acanthopleuribacter pedis]|uniref:Ribosomal protein L11 methyltransferase n=1 Tax=Acanthopleuribacter pedis TaxID=442870 RepID=A0A8J7QHW2_9BACT|nr:50S ribosomal protein L11 methyltransferase [Acanthopleuribacter pedis]MBO1320891.1 50S ribosomal protein L11 methyltransferase [Acanthopleuribacter pedis]
MKRVSLFVQSLEQEDFVEQWLWSDGAFSVSTMPPSNPDRRLEAVYEALDESDFDQRLQQAAVHWPGEAPPISICDIDPQDWQNNWRENFKPIQAGPFNLVGEWEGESSDDHTILIYPGQAFGTGQHETTRLVLEHMETLDLAGKRVLDIGCGTGILSIAAEKLGAAEVFGFDIDPDCRENMQHHLRINNSSKVTLEIGTLNDVNLPHPNYDLVLANITLNVLQTVWPQIPGLLAEGGHLISSGILIEQKDTAEALLHEQGFTMYRHTGLGEWLLLAAQRR